VKTAVRFLILTIAVVALIAVAIEVLISG